MTAAASRRLSHTARQGDRRRLKTALVLGDIHFDFLYPDLAVVAESIVVLATRPPERKIWPANRVTWVTCPPQDHAAAATRLASSLGPDLIVSRIRGTENEHDLLAHAALAAAASCDVVAHPFPFAEVSVDKVAQHDFARRHRLTTPRTRVAHSFTELTEAAQCIGFPAVLKTARGNAGVGTRFITDPCELALAVAELTLSPGMPYKGPFVLQEALEGEELSVEVVSARDRWWLFPFVSTGRLDSHMSPQTRLRTCPATTEPGVRVQVNAIVETLHQELRPNGTWQLDLAVSEGRVYLLEVNGRPGGVTPLSRAVTGVDPGGLAVHAHLGLVVPEVLPHLHAAIEIPAASNWLQDRADDPAITVQFQPSRTQPSGKLLIAAQTTVALRDALAGANEASFLDDLNARLADRSPQIGAGAAS